MDMSKMAILWLILLHLCCVHLNSGMLVNVALGKPVNVSSRHLNRDPGIAVDGDILARDPAGVMHSATGQSSAWWTVDLLSPIQDPTVKIFFRLGYKARRNGVRLYTSTAPFSTYPGGQLCHTVTGDVNGTDIPDLVTVNCSGTWRYLMVYTNTDNDGQGAVLDFGEVTVLGCVETYGKICDKYCDSRQCAVTPTSCDRHTGACPSGGCIAGWMGTDCMKACPRGKYGANCNKVCSSRHCAVEFSSCDQFSGACADGCEAGWTGTDCKEVCPLGRYGNNCRQLCSNRYCLTSSVACDHVTGACSDGCGDGWTKADCTQADGKMTTTCDSCNDSAESASIPNYVFGLIGGLSGAILAMVVGVGLHICFIRTGQLKWVKQDKAPESTEMNDVTRHEVPEAVTSDTESDLKPDYCQLGPKSDKDYDVIQNKHYENI